MHYITTVIRSFRNKALARLWLTGRSAKIRPDLKSRCLRRLDALNEAGTPRDMNIPGFNFHGLRGKPKRYSVHVNGPWCVTFGWDENDAVDVDLEQYH
jgi:proteic killer suppression protein